jgi:hypothetical protein
MSLIARYSWRTVAAWAVALAGCGLAWWALFAHPMVLCGLALALLTGLVLCNLLPSGCAFYRVPADAPAVLVGDVFRVPNLRGDAWARCTYVRRDGEAYRVTFQIIDRPAEETR